MSTSRHFQTFAARTLGPELAILEVMPDVAERMLGGLGAKLQGLTRARGELVKSGNTFEPALFTATKAAKLEEHVASVRFALDLAEGVRLEAA